MSTEGTPYREEQQLDRSPSEDWQVLTIGEEEFKVKKDRVFPTIRNGESVIFDVNTYHHIETGIQITLYSLGLQKPTSEPAIVRADYGCPCMSFGPSFTIPGHDCAKQRDIMMDTIAEVGIGAMAVVSEQTAAGNGHGIHVVFDQSTAQFNSQQNNEVPQTMQEFYAENGYTPFDRRRLDLVNKAILDTIGTERPVIPATANLSKIQEFKDVGLNVMEGARVDLITDTTGVHDHILRRDNFAPKIHPQQPGAYLSHPSLQHPMRLARETYDLLFQPETSFTKPFSAPRQRRIVN